MRSNSAESKRLRNGSYSTLITVIVIAVLIVINFIVNGLPATITKPDFSEQQLLTLSQQTKELVKGLTEDVTVYLVTQQDADLDSERNMIQQLVEKYASLSSRIHLEIRDSALYPAFAAQYTTGGLEDNSLVVESDRRFKVIPHEEIYQTVYSYTETYQTVQNTNFDGENQLTNAIDFVTSDNLPVAYTVTGHSEMAVPDALVSEITGQNIEMQSLNLIQTNKIPDDCSALVFYAPQKDITEAEETLIREYYEQGGGLFVVTSLSAGDTPRLDALLKEYGITFVDGIVLEGDTGYTYQNNADLLFARIDSHAITDPLIDGNMNVLVADAQAMAFSTEDKTITGTRLLSTSASGYAKKPNSTTIEKEDGDIAGTLTLGLAVEKQAEGGKSGKMVVYTTPMMFDNSANAYSAGGNYDLMINSFGWMCEHESAISIHAKSLDGEKLQISSAQANLWSTIVVAVVPILLLIAGIVIWVVRRLK